MKRNENMKYRSIILSLSLLTSLQLHAKAAVQDKPNIVLIFMDNFGWGEPGFNGGGIIRGAATPRMDQLAAEGLRLTNFNVEQQRLRREVACMVLSGGK
jgi:arylsulfatase